MGKVPKSSKWNTAVKLHVNTRYYAQHQALKSVYGESQSVIVGKLVFSSRAIFELTQGILDSKTSDWNCSFETVVRKEVLTICQDKVCESFLCVLSLSSVLGKLLHYSCIVIPAH